jgi:hypothetical protein
MTLEEFARDHCVGKEYDSCVNSPCPYASASGCTHPLHPKNNRSISTICVRGMPANFSGVTYLGRPCAGWTGSSLANQYHIGKDGTRAEVIDKYKRWLWQVVWKKDSPAWNELLGLVRTYKPLVLGCWCKLDEACHRDVVKAAILYLRREEAENLTQPTRPCML